MTKYLMAIAVGLVVMGCGKDYKRKPIDDYVVEYDKKCETFSIILEDMDMEENTFSSDVFRHKYRFIYTLKGDTVLQQGEATDFLQVPEDYFWENENNLGMALVTKEGEGKIVRKARPAGYGNYVGNRRYGHWNGGFWQFYGQYMFMSTMLNMSTYPISRGGYNDYNRNYRGTSRTYYGSDARNPRFGTSAKSTMQSRGNFYQRRASKSGWASSSRSTRTSGLGTSRSSGSSYRSSGGGYGK